ncbi:MAG: c-type cytochrome [Thiotrichales bacterium]
MMKPTFKYLAIVALSGCCGLGTASVHAAGDAARGKDKSQTCQSCHGVDGNSPTAQFPSLAGQYQDYLVHTLKAYQSGERKNAIMAGMVAGLSSEDIEDLAAFYAAQKGLYDTAESRFR